MQRAGARLADWGCPPCKLAREVLINVLVASQDASADCGDARLADESIGSLEPQRAPGKGVTHHQIDGLASHCFRKHRRREFCFHVD